MTGHDPNAHIPPAEPQWPARAKALRAALQQSAEQLDGASASRLNRSRHAALQASMPTRIGMHSAFRWGLGVAATAALAVMLWPSTAPYPVMDAATLQAEDLHLMVEDADPELIADLDFYAWLDEQGESAAAEAEEDVWEG